MSLEQNHIKGEFNNWTDHQAKMVDDVKQMLLEKRVMEILSEELEADPNPQLESKDENPIIRRLFWGFVTFLVIGVLGYLYFSNTYESPSVETVDYPAIAMTYFQPHQANIDRSITNNGSEYQKGLSLYSSRKYEEAILSFDKVGSDNPSHARAKFYAGCSRFALSNYDGAFLVFQNLLGEEQDDIRQASEWYSILLNFQRKDLPLAKQKLSDITQNPGHLYYDVAMKLEAEIMNE